MHILTVTELNDVLTGYMRDLQTVYANSGALSQGESFDVFFMSYMREFILASGESELFTETLRAAFICRDMSRITCEVYKLYMSAALDISCHDMYLDLYLSGMVAWVASSVDLLVLFSETVGYLVAMSVG